ncbi:MAG: tetratricopeptide repeat protein [Sedimentisphaerales bacterium]
MVKGKVWTRPQKIALVSVIVAAIGVLATIIGLYVYKSGDRSQKVDVKIKGDKNAVTITQNYGLDVNEARDIANEIVKPYKDENIRLFQESIDLKKQLVSAIQRAAEAEARGNNPETKGVIEELRKTGDTRRLLDVLVKERDLQRNSLVERNREIAAVAYLHGDIEVARAAVDEILKLNPEDMDALNQKGGIELLQGNLNEAEKIFSRILGMGLANNNDFWQAIGSSNLGLVYRTKGELDKAEEMFNKSLEIAEKSGLLVVTASEYSNLGVIYQMRGELDKAEKMHKKSLEIEKKLGHLERMAENYGNLGNVYQTKGELDKAEEMYGKVLDIEKQLNRPDSIANAFGNLGLIYRKRGELDRAEEMHKKSLEIAEKVGLQEIMAIQYGNLGVIYKMRGELDKAEEMYKKSLEIDERISRQEGMANQYGNLGGIYMQRGDLGKAKEYWEKARDLFQKIGMPNKVKQMDGWLETIKGK